jgi:anaerobic selenocysteine-containing dehydrogenase
MKKLVHAACPHDCPDACGVLITVENGRAVKIQGDPDHPITRGFLCAKVARYLDRVYSPHRLLSPMKRVARKGVTGPDQFTRISWDEALDSIASRFNQITKSFGPEAILPYSYGGTLGALNGASMDRRFFHRLGASQLARTICSEAGGEGLKSVLGVKYGTEPEQFRHSRTIIAWGANIHGNNVHLWPFVEEARHSGAKLIVIDPYRTRTAACADSYLPINPGTDAALALGMMHVIISENLHDADYIAQHTIGFAELQRRVDEHTPEAVSHWTGISPEDICKLARQYANARPAVIRVNYGVQRCDSGGMAVRAIAMLPCITGSWKEVGGGLQLSTSGAFPLDRKALELPDLMLNSPLGRPARTINMSGIGKALTTQLDPPIKALFVYNSNPAAIAPNRSAVIRGLMRDDLFTVVHEQFLTDTCDYADIVLPATTFFEHKDLQPSYGHYYLQISQPAIEPLGECMSNVDLFRALAQRMEFCRACFRDSDDDMIDAALASEHKFLDGIDRERLERDGHVRLNFGSLSDEPFLPFANGGFATPSGKAELYSETLAGIGLDPVACFAPPIESRHSAQSDKFPLELLARKANNFLNSTFANLSFEQHLESPDTLEINSLDSKSRGIRNGDSVRVFNDRGELRLTALIREDSGNTSGNCCSNVQPGTVAATLNWAKLSRDGGNVNVLISDRLTDLGSGPTFYSVLVDVERLP